jgi:phage/plasmid-associated DNA primase
MKELTGNDKLFVRGLYQEGAVMKPMFSLILLCNHKPRVPPDDEGTWRRLVILDFSSKFVDSPNGPGEFPKDPYLAQRFPEWAPYFLALLTMWFRIYKKEGLKPPKEISDATLSYRNEGDSYTDFIATHLVADPCANIKLEDSYVIYKEWYSMEYNEKPPTRRDYKTLMGKRLKCDYKNGWNGWKLKQTEGALPDTNLFI